MGFHVCEYCGEATSSGDVTLTFSSGRSWQMPDMIIHYIREHGWCPPTDFIYDVENKELVEGDRKQTRGLKQKPTPVGYLSGPVWPGRVSEGFADLLEELMRKATSWGHRLQTKGYR